MKTIVHLSDLHFGKINYDTLEPLTNITKSINPDVVVVSGDITQRATIAQFKEAREFLLQLPKPQIIIPGNHDIPLYNVFRRFVKPLKRFKMFIGEDVEPLFQDNKIVIIGLNTTRPFLLKEGGLSKKQLTRLTELLNNCAPDMVKIIVTHHPFDIPPNHKPQPVVYRSSRAMKLINRHQPDLFLSGHLHVSHTSHSAIRYKVGNFNSLLVLAGTATSIRNRKELNSFNVIKTENKNIIIQKYSWHPQNKNFAITQEETFIKKETGWQEADKTN